MNRIVRDGYPVADLPEDLREGFAADDIVRVIIEADLKRPDKVLTLDEMFAMRKPPFRTTEEIVGDVRRQRDEWE